jgi:hypothetical protein
VEFALGRDYYEVVPLIPDSTWVAAALSLGTPGLITCGADVISVAGVADAGTASVVAVVVSTTETKPSARRRAHLYKERQLLAKFLCELNRFTSPAFAVS